jgi:hypothetical protein
MVSVPVLHEMLLQDRQAAGAEEWGCPACGRRLVLRWSPYAKVVIARGDEHAVHRGGGGEVRIAELAVSPAL